MGTFPTPRRILRESLPPTEAEKLLSLKNEVVLQLETARKQKSPNPTVVKSLATQAAKLEEQVADGHVAAGQNEEAATNFISAASCWVQAGNKTDALRALDRARELSTKPAMHRWIKNYLKQIENMGPVA
jgi:hypothetical protein